jgi:hypothetical protein
MSPPAPRPALAFHQYAVHLGEVPSGPSAGAHFEFVNRSDRTIRITGIKPSCGCVVTKIVDQRRQYRPGEFGMFQASLATANEQPGPHDYTITVQYDDGQPREQSVRLTLTLPAPTVQLEPRELYFYQLNGNADSRIVEVVDFRENALEIKDAELRLGHEKCPESIATATVLQPQPAAEGPSRLPIRIDVSGDVPPARLIAHLVITTSDDAFRTLKVPVLIQGPRKGVVPASATEPADQSTVPH